MHPKPSARAIPNRSFRTNTEIIATINGMVPGSKGPTSAAGTKRIALATTRKKKPPAPKKQARKGHRFSRRGQNPTLIQAGASTVAGTMKRSQPTVAGGRWPCTA